MKKIGLIITLLAVMALLFSGCRDDSLEAQLERAKSAADSANKAYQGAQEQLDKIYKDKEAYDKMQEKFK